jgi:hypothetical protein
MSLTASPPRVGLEPPDTTRRSQRGTLLVGALFALGVLIVELRYLPMPYPSDQINYFESARDFPHPPHGIPVHQFLRLGLVLPMRLAIELFGYSQTAYYAVPVLTGLSMALAVYLLGTLMFSRAVGVIAGALTVGNNVIFFDLLQPLPDVLATSLFTWALVLTIAIRQGRPVVGATARRRVLALLGIGALLGWSYLTREYIVFAWPVVVVLLARRVGRRGLLLVAAPLVLTGVLEMAVGAYAYGGPLARLHAASAEGSGPTPEYIAATFQDMPRTWYLSRLIHGMSLTPERWWLYAMVVGTVIGGLILWRRLGVLLAWAAIVYVPLVLLGGLLDPSQPMLRLFKMRYWFPLFPAIILGGVAAAWLLVRAGLTRVPRLRDRAGFPGLAAGVTVLLLAIWPLALAHSAWGDTNGYRVVGKTHMDQFRSWLDEHKSQVQTIWSDRRTVRVIPIYAHGPIGGAVWHGRIATLSDGGAQPSAGDYVLLFSTRSARLCPHCKEAAEAALGNPIQLPGSWLQVFGTSDSQLLVYRVG